jgi:hypothetical protein
VNGNALAVNARNGTSSTVQLKGDSPVVVVEKRAMSDIKDNWFVRITATQLDGTIKAIEVHVSQNRCEEPAKGTILGT